MKRPSATTSPPAESATINGDLSQQPRHPRRLEAVKIVDRAVVASAAVALLALLVQVVADATSRTLVGSSMLKGGLEYITGWWMVTITFAGLYVAQRRGEHIVATVLLERQARAFAKAWHWVAVLVTVAGFAALALYGWESAEEKRAINEFGPLSGIPLWPFRYWVLIGAAATASALLVSLFARAPGRAAGPEDLPPVADDLAAADVAMPSRGTQMSPRGSLITTLIMITALGFTLFVQFTTYFTYAAVGVASLIQMLLLLGLSVPVGVAMLLAGSLGIAAIDGWVITESTLRTIPYATGASWSMSVLPMFILMGILLWRSGVTEQAYAAARLWVGGVPAGLAITTNTAGAGLAAVSGSTVGISYALTRIGVPEMLKSGYSPRMATGSVLVAGLAGQLIPPSLMMVVYAGVAGTPVGRQLMAGVIPGVLLAVGFAMVMLVIGIVSPKTAPRTRINSTLSDRLQALAKAWPIPTLMLVVVVGIYAGIFTATEAGAFGALAAILVTALRVGLRSTPMVVARALVDAVAGTAAVMLLLIGAGVISRLLTLSGVGALFTDAIASLGLSRVGLLLVLMVLFIAMGVAIESLTIMFIMVPLLVPILETYDVSLIWFGAFIVLAAELAVITPPVGVLAFIVHRVTQDPEVRGSHDITLRDVFIGGSYFIPVGISLLILLIFFPALAEWLPTVGNVK